MDVYEFYYLLLTVVKLCLWVLNSAVLVGEAVLRSNDLWVFTQGKLTCYASFFGN